ncbi:MAG: HEPN domain-containing protein [Drouetiella hepatica Uher 2000/2452]|jgi:uncharacterized protein (UPF0332 family)|uniref:HEPN domain-containing protein n=1 Tax=Drouetiella hepatica Uher 2000/2452 TaxID=904376 RepID=A0A951QBL2_9CYAN|nr:HEPN domain-containing protein [Drouetiella hepatica Uher 2000/2452]
MTPEQRALLQKAYRSLDAAELLNQQNMPEFAASRAYYTMFYVAEAFLEGKGLSFSKHSAVISAFGREFVKAGAVPTEFHRFLITAEQLRLQGDYDANPDLTEAQATEQIHRAKQFLELAEAKLTHPPIS